MKNFKAIALVALVWLGAITSFPSQFPTELPFGSQAKVTDYIRGEINQVSVFLVWNTPVKETGIGVSREHDSAYHRETDGELEKYISERIESILNQFLAGETDHPEALKEGEVFHFMVLCDTIRKYDSPTWWATYLRPKMPDFTLQKVNGQWTVPVNAFAFELPFKYALNVFHLPDVRWVESLKRNNLNGAEEHRLTRNGVEDTDTCPYGSPADLFGNGMVYLGSSLINGYKLDREGVWGKVTFWTNEGRTEGVTYDLETGKMVVQKTTIKPVGSGGLEITLRGAEPGKLYTLVESGQVVGLSSTNGNPVQAGVAGENWQVQFVAQRDPSSLYKFFSIRPGWDYEKALLSTGSP